MLASLLSGAALGLSVAAPFGPIALLCVQRSITLGLRPGVATGLGAASVQVLYATLAISGAGALSHELMLWGHVIRLVACALLVLLGLRVLRRRPPAVRPCAPIRARAAFASSFALALCNPLTIMPYLLVASGAAATGLAGTALSPWSACGVFAGAAGWYCAVSGAATLFRSGLPPGAVRALNRVAGAMLIGFGLLTACR